MRLAGPVPDPRDFLTEVISLSVSWQQTRAKRYCCMDIRLRWLLNPSGIAPHPDTLLTQVSPLMSDQNRSPENQSFLDTSFLQGANAVYLEQMAAA